MYPVEIRDLPRKRIAALRHRGAYTNIADTVRRVRKVFDARALWAEGQHLVAVFYDDPNRVPEFDLSSHAGVEVGDAALIHELFDTVILRPGRYAVMRVEAPYAEVRPAYDWLLGIWLTEAGETADHNEPIHEVVLAGSPDLEPGACVTEICVPLV